jgi:Arc/MetJ-type ribon-helix-helix transcriptional regulator
MNTKLSVSLPGSLEEWVRLRVRYGGYGSISEYFRELVRIDQRFELAKRDHGTEAESKLLNAARRSSGDRFRT